MPQKKPRKIKRWFLFCEPCSHKQIIEKFEDTDLYEIPRADVPGGSPKLDPVKKKTVLSPSTPQPKMFKCPQCGRGCACKNLPDVYEKVYKEIDDNKRKEREEEERRKRMEDGKPVERSAEEEETEFLG